MGVLLAAGVLAGCGGDDEPAAGGPSTVPDLTVPQTDDAEPPEPEPETTAPSPPPAPAPAGTDTDGGAPAPAPEPPPDSPENDAPPPADSPAERFEEFCDANPGACG